MNIWHIAEAASFFIFLIFAPMNLFQYNESLRDSESNEVIESVPFATEELR